MSSNVVNQSPFIPTSREYPPDMEKLLIAIDKTNVDTANAVNNRTISIFPTNRPAINGESWFVSNRGKQQGLRQVYTFTSTADIPIGFKIASVNRFTCMYGTYTDGTNFYGLIDSTSVGIVGQIGFFIFQDVGSTTTDLIRFTSGGGEPALTSGTIVLEWLSQP